jgi:hypothetical protein
MMITNFFTSTVLRVRSEEDLQFEVLGSHGSKYQDGCFLGCPYSLVCLHHWGIASRAASISEMSVDFYQTTWHATQKTAILSLLLVQFKIFLVIILCCKLYGS